MVTEDSRYNLKYITVVERNTEILGAIILIPYDELDSLSIKTDLKIIHHYDNIFEKVQFILDSLKYMIFRECRRGNLYIANIATAENARGLGVGKMLMTYAEQMAKIKNFNGISLIAKNEAVTKFYEKLNYKKVFDKILLGERVIKMVKFV
ncbi:MAG: GNAT family N-acetyltransferase [Clostridium sp.]